MIGVALLCSRIIFIFLTKFIDFTGEGLCISFRFWYRFI